MVYKTPAYEGFEGFPLGNGDLGGMVWSNVNGLEIQINKNDLFDQPNKEAGATLRGGARLSIDFGAPVFDWLYLDDYDGRLSLQNADVSIKSITPFMESDIRTWVSANKNVWFVEVTADSKGSRETKLRTTLERYGSRAFPGWYGGYTGNTQIGIGNSKAITIGNDIVLEECFDGLDFTVACRLIGAPVSAEKVSENRAELTTGLGGAHTVTIMIALVTSNESDAPTKEAIKLLDEAESVGVEREKLAHHDWWKSFWGKSFVKIDAGYLENLYYLRRYLMGSSSRGKYPVVFNGGLWTWNHDVRNWVTPHHWNTQQQYWGLAPQNDCELMLPYLDTYYRIMPEAEKHAKMRGADNAILWSEAHDFFGRMTFWDRGDMINNFTPASQIAGFFWEYFQYTCDTVFLEKKAYPFLKKAAEFYVQTLQWDKSKNEFFISPSQPYESPRSNKLKNTITDRNMIISTMTACISSAKILERDNKKVKEWQHIIDHLWPIPFREEEGIGEIMQLGYNQDGSVYPKKEDYGDWTNHFSANTLLVFPTNIIGIDQKGSREYNAAANVVKSHSPSKNAISPDPIVAARLGLGDVALERITNQVRRLQHFPQGLFYNIDHWYYLSLYADSVKTPDITTQRDYIYDERCKYEKGHPAKPFIQCGLEPMSICTSTINEMLLQSNGGKIRVFPAVPEGWNPAFKLRARGAFIVSSEMKEGVVKTVHIESLKGSTCKLVNPWPGQRVDVLNGNDESVVKVKQEKDGVIVFDTKALGKYIIVMKGTKPSMTNTVFKSIQNNQPKHFKEAVLGKERNF
ncbi:glycoside hydrolase N-terminal domain-containing protein [Carboxylicivirga sediminis]|uniref:Glycoside hydrolase N-terminal domain-containing protein n=1 Tax=Carboxylicivirga sediminis TaxID=2006564 RepID=A0A941F302_9BACT|nr:DUF5703 domain-containing protein [Carboxylicivirga sediminis]MBR8535851.1 glycoside hydrolase N-terminal domain-containing protein [Carboxylicivirga sediminis]